MIKIIPGGVVIDVRVIPRAAKSELAGTRNGALIVRLQAPPLDGAANVALVGFLAARLDVPKRAVTILGGERTRSKRVRVCGVDLDRALERLVPGAE